MSAAAKLSDPPWLKVARSYLGTTEVPGKGDNPTIQRWLRTLRAAWSDDATPWCGTFVAQCMYEAGLDTLSPKAWYRARAWLDCGYKLATPVYGCIVVFERGGGGHVGFCVGKDARGRLMILGGNQGDTVSIRPFEWSRALGYRWPAGPVPLFAYMPLPILASNGLPSSSNEA